MVCEIHFCYILWFRRMFEILHSVRNCPSLSPVASCPSHAMQNFRIDMQNCYMLDFFLWFSSLHLLLAWQPIAKLGKGLWSGPKLRFFMYLSFNFHCHGLHKILPHSLLVSMIKKLPKTPKLAKNWLVTLARFLNVPIELTVLTTTQKCLKQLISSYKRALFE